MEWGILLRICERPSRSSRAAQNSSSVLAWGGSMRGSILIRIPLIYPWDKADFRS